MIRLKSHVFCPVISCIVLTCMLLLAGCQATAPATSTSSGEYSRDSGISSVKGIQNCHSYTWWQLTGSSLNFVSHAQLKTELERRGYKGWVLTSVSNIPLKMGDVITIEGTGVDHSGFVLYDGYLSHFRSTQVHRIVKDTGNLPASMQVNGLETVPGRFVIADPSKLNSYPGDFIDWLLNQSTNKGITQQEIDEKVKNLSIGFWHDRDSLDNVKELLYPDENPTITIWKLPASLELEPVSQELGKDNSATIIAWLAFDPSMKKVNTADHKDIRVYWNDPGEPEVIKNGVVKGSSLKEGENIVKASVEIIQPWAFISDAAKSEMVGQDAIKWLHAQATVTVKEGQAVKEYYICPECTGATTRQEKADCMQVVVVVNGQGLDEINRITDTELRDWGYYWYARKYGRMNICDYIEDPEIKEWCQYTQ